MAVRIVVVALVIVAVAADASGAVVAPIDPAGDAAASALSDAVARFTRLVAGRADDPASVLAAIRGLDPALATFTVGAAGIVAATGAEEIVRAAVAAAREPPLLDLGLTTPPDCSIARAVDLLHLAQRVAAPVPGRADLPEARDFADVREAIATLADAHGRVLSADEAAAVDAFAASVGPMGAPIARLISAHLVQLDAARIALSRAGDDGVPDLALMRAARDHLAAVALEEAPRLTPNAGDDVIIPGIFHVSTRDADSSYAEDVAFLLDLGGDDAYSNNAGGAIGTDSDSAAAVLIDVDGSDTYARHLLGRTDAFAGGGYRGSGFLLDLAGDDAYDYRLAPKPRSGGPTDEDLRNVQNASAGAATGGGVLGSGALIDVAGSDRFFAEVTPDRAQIQTGAVNGASVLGDGLLVDGCGRDERRATIAVGGAANGATFHHALGPSPDDAFDVGSATLIDGSGDDTYQATFVAGPDGPCGCGDANGAGTGGVLIDLGGGADRYAASMADGGSANGAGRRSLLIDDGGADVYDATFGRFGVANGASVGTGLAVLWDAGGDDRYAAFVERPAHPLDLAANGASAGARLDLSPSAPRGPALAGARLTCDELDDAAATVVFFQCPTERADFVTSHTSACREVAASPTGPCPFGRLETPLEPRPDLNATCLFGRPPNDNLTSLVCGLSADRSIGVLLDGAGHDVYESEGATQGAATRNGIGVLIDADGPSELPGGSPGSSSEDHFISGDGSLAQGAGVLGGVGVAILHGEENRIRAGAAARAQGFGQAAGVGVLVDFARATQFAMDPGSFGPGVGFFGVGVVVRVGEHSTFVPAAPRDTFRVGGGGLGLIVDSGSFGKPLPFPNDCRGTEPRARLPDEIALTEPGDAAIRVDTSSDVNVCHMDARTRQPVPIPYLSWALCLVPRLSIEESLGAAAGLVGSSRPTAAGPPVSIVDATIEITCPITEGETWRPGLPCQEIASVGIALPPAGSPATCGTAFGGLQDMVPPGILGSGKEASDTQAWLESDRLTFRVSGGVNFVVLGPGPLGPAKDAGDTNVTACAWITKPRGSGTAGTVSTPLPHQRK